MRHRYAPQTCNVAIETFHIDFRFLENQDIYYIDEIHLFFFLN